MRWVKRIAFSFVFVAVLIHSAQGHSRGSHCTRVRLATETRWGGNETIAIDLRDEPRKIVMGTVVGPGVGALSTLVQVFPRKPSEPFFNPQDQEVRTPVAACITGDDGFFSFSLPSGEYELRMSQNGGVDVTSVFVTVKRASHNSEKIKIEMHVGT